MPLGQVDRLAAFDIPDRGLAVEAGDTGSRDNPASVFDQLQ